jgi:hypothetical protein
MVSGQLGQHAETEEPVEAVRTANRHIVDHCLGDGQAAGPLEEEAVEVWVIVATNVAKVDTAALQEPLGPKRIGPQRLTV